MFRFTVALASLLVFIQVLMITPVHAMGYSACIGLKDASTFRTVYGFHLWATNGTQAHHYVTQGIFQSHKYAEDKGWRVGIFFEKTYRTFGLIRPVIVKNKEFKIDDKFNSTLTTICQYTHKGRFRSLSILCKEDPKRAGWCSPQNTRKISEWCADYLDMGIDSLSCNITKRPTQ
ncbi:hypothetical protein BGZ94_008559 [Podila epigama]|nr:hypothetical protein BGZ94_008559 [Podila epigama]